MSDAEKQLLILIGKETIEAIIRWRKIAESNGVELEELMKKAREDNTLTIYSEKV